jgi:hypothetical protein
VKRAKNFTEDLSPFRSVTVKCRPDGLFDLCVPEQDSFRFKLRYMRGVKRDEVEALVIAMSKALGFTKS